MKWLTVNDLGIIHIQIIDASGGAQGIRDNGRLQSAIAAMQQAVFGEELYPTVFEKAASLLRAVIADHPFVDGNKRTAMVSALAFLNLNGYDTSPLENQELEDFAVQVAVEHLSIQEIASWLEEHSQVIS